LTSDPSVVDIYGSKEISNMFSEKIKQLALTFASAVTEAAEGEMRAKMTDALSALGGGSGEVHHRQDKTPKAKSKKEGGRLARRSLEEIQAVVADVVKLVSKHKEGLNSQTIRTTLNLDVREVPRVLKEGVSSGLLKSHGQKRATMYFAGKGGRAPKRSAKPKVKAAGKKAKKAKAAPKKVAGKKASKKTFSKVSKSMNGAAGHATSAAEATA
jgi:hypothetical protein